MYETLLFVLPSSRFNKHLTVNFVAKRFPFIEVVPTEECQSVEHLDKFFQDILDKGGEGIILRDPTAPYQPGRSLGFLKHKASMLRLSSSTNTLLEI